MFLVQVLEMADEIGGTKIKSKNFAFDSLEKAQKKKDALATSFIQTTLESRKGEINPFDREGVAFEKLEALYIELQERAMYPQEIKAFLGDHFEDAFLKCVEVDHRSTYYHDAKDAYVINISEVDVE